MSYTPTEWESTDVVTAIRMNALETAVGDMNMSYTPNTWSDGDILSAEKMNALEQAVASGGGSSDFSTAEVTIVNNTTYTGVFGQAPVCYEGNEGLVPYSACYTVLPLTANTTQTFKIAMYKGKAGLTSQGEPSSISGNIESIGNNTYLITGDCTITIS